MKKLGIIVALALIVTIGGAYATWNYTVSNGVVEAKNETASITLEEMKTIQLQEGTITIEGIDTVKITVDDDGSHNATLKIEGEITVSFTGTAQEDGASKAIALKCTASDNCGDYDTQYITNGDGTAKVFKYGTLTSGKEVSDTNKWVITADDLKELIQLNGTVSAPTSDQYTLLQTAINGKTITLTFSAVE